MKTILLSFFFFTSFTLSAQDTTWFDGKWKECARSEASYYHLESSKGKLVYYTDYFFPSHKVQNTGSYLYGMEHGHFIWYHETGQKSSEVEYVNGKRDGVYMEWDEEGIPLEKRSYEMGRPVGPTMTYSNATETWAEVLEISDGGHDLEEADEPRPNETIDDYPHGSYDFILLEEEPTPLNMDSIKRLIGYPAEAKKDKIEGKVVVNVLVNELGQFEKYTLVKDPAPILSEAVTSHLKYLRFSPAVQAGRKIRAWVSLPFDFKLSRKRVF